MRAGDATLGRNKMMVAGIDLEVFEAGQGCPLIFLHSGQGYDPWQGFAAQLAANRRLIAPSHPGFGKSSLPNWIDSIDDIAYLYLELADRLDVAKADIVGCSIGGWIAAEMASKTPERVGRLVLIGPPGVKVGSPDKLDIPDLFAMPQDEVNKLIYRDPAGMAPDQTKIADDELNVVFRNRESLALLTWEPWMHNPKLKHRLHRVKAPSLFVRGEHDGLISAEYLSAYARLLPNATTLTIAGAGHLPHLEQPQALAAAIFSFLEQ
jgi:pimeloyl-ACP methyl ester carboxylesterase